MGVAPAASMKIYIVPFRASFSPHFLPTVIYCQAFTFFFLFFIYLFIECNRKCRGYFNFLADTASIYTNLAFVNVCRWLSLCFVEIILHIRNKKWLEAIDKSWLFTVQYSNALKWQLFREQGPAACLPDTRNAANEFIMRRLIDKSRIGKIKPEIENASQDGSISFEFRHFA